MRKRNPSISSQFPGIVVSGRVRIARNLQNERFPNAMTDSQRHAVRDILCTKLLGLPAFHGGKIIRMDELSSTELLRLVEAHQISAELSMRGEGGALVVHPLGDISVMINEEDHLRIQVIRSDGDVRKAWQEATHIDMAIESCLQYAFHDTYGFLTACPSNMGTGLRVSAMLQLIGLSMAEECDRVFKALDRLGFAVRGIWGEGSEATGHLFQVSNQQTLGETEDAIVTRLERVVQDVVKQERNARLCLLARKPWIARDAVARCVAILKNAQYMSSAECLDFLSALRFGVECDMVSGASLDLIDQWSVNFLPGHLQSTFPECTDETFRDRFRADRLRALCAKVKLRRAPPPLKSSHSRSCVLT